jgi:hypothetical protein
MNNAGVIKTLHLVEAEPSWIVEETLNGELWQALKLDTPPPAVVFKKFIGDHGGLCSPVEDTEAQEIELKWDFQSTTCTFSPRQSKKNLCSIYLHEIAHRLSNRTHVAIFATLNFCLHIRASKIYPDLWQTVALYDFQNHAADGSEIDMVDAFAFIFRVGAELAESELSTTQLVKTIEERWGKYHQQVIDRPRREKEERNRMTQLLEENYQLRMDRFKYAGYGALAMLALAFLNHIL